MVEIICYSKCSTCSKVKDWLKNNAIEYSERDIKINNPNKDELELWYKSSGLPLKRFFNTSGLIYKELNLKSRLVDMSETEQLELLATDGMLVKRPILLVEGKALPGFKEAEWREALGCS